MLYEAANWSLSHAWKIGYATSADGLNWTKSVKNPVLTDVGSVGGPQVSKVGSRYHLWYQNSPTNALPTDIARASSEDLTSWRKYEGGRPVFLRTETYEGRGNNSITDGGQVADISMVEVGNRTFALYAAVPDQSSGTIAMAIAGTPIAGLVK
jgi:hypothetical protein